MAFTALANGPSRGLMRRLGMRPDGAFDRPRLPGVRLLRPYLLYRLRRDEWARAAEGAGPRGG